jgi:hypothetical protein
LLVAVAVDVGAEVVAVVVVLGNGSVVDHDVVLGRRLHRQGGEPRLAAHVLAGGRGDDVPRGDTVVEVRSPRTA